MRKKLKRNLFVCITVILILTIAGCGAKDNAPTTESVSETADATMDTTLGVIMTDEEIEKIFNQPAETLAEENTEPDSANDTAENQDHSNTEKPQTETKPIAQETEPTVHTPSNQEYVQTEYERYMAMSGDEQYEFFQSFESPEAFMNWLNAAQAEYEELHPTKELDGVIDLEEIFEAVE